MKPILLKLSGLQSYRAQQEIDFASLTETGLFGIFGPTGSGKSSLLDAITLAMYGKVERAVNGTQGIMNHSEDQLSVAFTFELNSSSGARRYRVERKFKRTGEQSVSNTISRFIEVKADGDLVMADKLAEVTRCVEEHIGLKMDDFTRAVVLPQGKFAEFLSLRGVDRRQMLQRLFHLEQYGDGLALKLSRRVKENEAALRALEAEQQGLGSAGKADVEAAAVRVQEAIRHAADCRGRLTEAAERAERFVRIRELQEERARRESQRQGLLAKEEQILLLEQKLGKADEAERRLPALKAWRSAEEAWKARAARAGGLEALAAAAVQEAAAGAEAEAAAQTALSAGEPALREEEGRYRRALELEAELGALHSERAALQARREEAARGLAAGRESLARERELLARGQKKQYELQQSLQPLAVRSQERQSLQEAMQRLQGLRSAEAQRESAERERQGRAAVLAAAEARLSAAGSRRQALDAGRGELLAAAALHQEELRTAEGAAGDAAGRLEGHISALEAALKEQEVHRLSQALAGELQEGVPCPVCGSEHHPSPALQQKQGDPEELDNRLRHVRVQARQALEARHLLRSLLEQDSSWLAGLAGAASEEALHQSAAGAAGAEPASDKTASITSHAAPVPKLSSSSGSDAASNSLNSSDSHAAPDSLITPESPGSQTFAQLPDEQALSALDSWLSALNEQLAALRGRSAELRRAASDWQRSLQELEQVYHKEAAGAEAEKTWLQGLSAKAEELAASAGKLREEWSRLFPELAPEEAERTYQEMLGKDERAEEIRSRLEISVKFLDEKNLAVQTLNEQLAGLDKELAQWDAQLEGKEALARDKEQRLREGTGGQPARELLAACERRLLELQTALERSRQEHRRAADKAQQQTREAAVARQAAESAQEHYTAAAAQWEESLQSSPFASAAEVEASSLETGERAQAAERVKSYREEEAECLLQLRSIEEKLAGAVLSNEEWQESQDALLRCKEEDEASLQARARAERDLEDLQQRHIRWVELEDKRAGHAAMQERLSKLQTVLRGNAFVEYIAEEQLMQVCQAASQRLRFLSKQRYALEVDSGGGFVIRDDGNGGVRRPVSTLSGGETFLTSLSLALALSAQIQLRGQYPLQFFFLDEGFGTLDPDLLDTVITSLERLHNDQLSVGIISHVPELRARLPRKLIVVPAEQGGGGSTILLEKM
ncbi:SMC domain-containing protein [Paenibacillus sp. FSL R7-269]|uniref:AAA family ATPase n=1 Tax=Paenibacillus sp. FSL R7-269 TaxID=1226755 RepID=UPI0003E2703B|nr:AAA family ATPase [Paenibacillus sp. FSL R7-269]ETT56736.1 SMC domain-containing protein [Paenibacillus sp. FSL R7-269]